jgi:hypothetical protein
MVGHFTVLQNAMGGQRSMSCGTSNTEAYCQQSEIITQGQKDVLQIHARRISHTEMDAKGLPSIVSKDKTVAVIRLRRYGWKVMDHRLYSPDLTPNNF